MRLFVVLFVFAIGVSAREPFINRKKIHETRDGDIVDCVDIHQQPSLNHPYLKNHLIQMNPSWKTTNASSSRASPPRPQYGLAKPCPMNTVPILRSRFSAVTNLDQKIATTWDPHYVHVAYNGEDVLKYGAGADISVYNLNLTQDQFSSHHIWVVANNSALMAGWRVDPELYGDSQTRFFTLWSGDEGGCYDTMCPGFIQLDSNIYPGIVILPASTTYGGGLPLTTRLDMKMDQLTGNWWLMYDRMHPIGYWPKELVKSLGGGATFVAWGGIGMAGNDGICPPLGNGHFPDEPHTAMYMRDVEYVDHDYRYVSINDVELWPTVDVSGCYGLQQSPKGVIDDRSPSTYYLYFGGPGGCPCAV